MISLLANMLKQPAGRLVSSLGAFSNSVHTFSGKLQVRIMLCVFRHWLAY